MTKIVLLNGPPGCGKDFAGDLIVEATNSWAGRPVQRPKAHAFKFAEMVKLGVHRAYDVQWQDSCGGSSSAVADHFESRKDQPCEELFGRTPRECYIAFSETLMKPLHGPRIFGDLLLREYGPFMGNCLASVVTDSGFRPEAEVLVEHFGAGNCFLVRIHPLEVLVPWWKRMFKKKKNPFAGDSRGWVDLSDLGVTSLDVVNPMTSDFKERLRPVIEWIRNK